MTLLQQFTSDLNKSTELYRAPLGSFKILQQLLQGSPIELHSTPYRIRKRRLSYVSHIDLFEAMDFPFQSPLVSPLCIGPHIASTERCWRIPQFRDCPLAAGSRCVALGARGLEAHMKFPVIKHVFEVSSLGLEEMRCSFQYHLVIRSYLVAVETNCARLRGT